MADNRAAFLEALGPHVSEFERAFIEAVMDIRSVAAQTTIDEIVKRFYETRDIERAVLDMKAAIQFASRGFFGPLDRAYDNVFYASGVWQLSQIPKSVSTGSPQGQALIVRFDGRHPRAEAWTRRHSAALITEITDDTEKVIRETLTEAVEQGRPYRGVTRDLIGRTDGNQRTGGLIGLHSRQARAVRAARGDLEALDARYFTRTLRDRRFDKTVRKAIESGKALSQADIDRITGRYADRLLQARGRLISRTESNKAMNAGRAEGITQMIDRGEILAEHVTKRWEATPGPRTRDSHRALGGTEVKWGEQFISPVTGAAMDWPHDEDAPAAETANCRCSCTFRTDFKAVMLWRRQQRAD